MPDYSNDWTANRPLGSAQANTVDDEIRALRLDIQERMNDLVEDWTADPVKINPTSLPQSTAIKLFIGPYGIQPGVQGDVNQHYGDGGFQSASAQSSTRCNVSLPVGCVVTKFEVMALVSTSPSLAVTLMKTTWVAGGTSITVTPTDFALTLPISPVIAIVATPDNTAAETVSDNFVYWIKNSGPGGQYIIYGYLITYDLPAAAA